MLLRLLPIPTPEQPSPPTILFTLPLPTHPYTSRSLPLPANLHAHRSVCLQEDIECPNVLLGEKSSWIGGIIDEVTFSLASETISVRYIDDTMTSVPLTPECTFQLRNVIQQVHLSFQPAPVEAPPRSSTSSTASTSSAASVPTAPQPLRRTPSSLLFSFLSPLLSANQRATTSFTPRAPPAQPPARVHRRLARSLLVDAYRRHVLPALREQTTSAYLPWAINSELARHQSEFESLRGEIQSTLASAGVDVSFSTPMKRVDSATSSETSHSGDLSESESDDEEPVTPATSVFSPTPSECSYPRKGARRAVNPSAYLLTLPPAPTVADSHRTTYSSQLARLSLLVSRMSSIRKLNAKYEREEGKRRWLESLERGRAGDKALRKAFSNGEKTPNVRLSAEPLKRSGLWRSWTLDDQMRAEVKESAKAALHPAMMEPIDEVISSDEETEVDHRSDSTSARSRSPRIHIPSSENPFAEATSTVRENVIHVAQPYIDPAAFEDANEPPALSPPSSPSDSASDLDEEPQTPTRERTDDGLFSPPRLQDVYAAPPATALIGSPLCRHKPSLEASIVGLMSPTPKIKELVDWEGEREVEEVETFAGVEMVYA